MRLGKLAARLDARTLQFTSYALPRKLPVPPACDWVSLAKKAWPAYRNDVLGTCTVAAAAHLVHAWTSANEQETVVDESAVLSAYSALSRYDGRPETDIGATALDTLKFWRKHGIGGHHIEAFAAVDHQDFESVRAGIGIFGGVFVGLQMPTSAMGREVWTVETANSARGSWGGHAVALLAFDEAGLIAISCGDLVRMTWSFLSAYADEAYAFISEDYIREQASPQGFDIHALRADLKSITRDT